MRIGTLHFPRLLLVALLLSGVFSPPRLTAQAVTPASGRVVGRVLDAETGAPLPGVQIEIVGAGIGTLSGVDGRYVVASVPIGQFALRLQMLGYETKTVYGLFSVAGRTVEQDVTLPTQVVQIEGITVAAAAERGSVQRALDQQRNAVGVTSAIASEQIARSPDSDAAAAVQRVSGVTVQDGRYVFVRGLGERYTTASLNGARIPSPEPERRMVPLDLFPTSLLETITTSKTFTPDQPGDFSGAQVDIRTRDFPAGRQFVLSTSIGYNTAATGSTILLAPREAGDFFAAGSGARELPGAVRAAGALRGELSQPEANRLIGAFRNAWSPREVTAAPNSSISASLGGSGEFFGRHVGYVASGTYSVSSEMLADQRRAYALPDAGNATREIDRFEGSTGRLSVLWGGLLNTSALLGSHSRFMLNGTYNRTSDQEARSEAGISENLGIPLLVQRLRYVERSVGSLQLEARHQLGARHGIDWRLTGSRVSRVEPDRSEVVFTRENDPVTGEPLPAAWFSSSNEGAVRTFGELSEHSGEASAAYRVQLGGAAGRHQVRFGGLVRHTERDADNRAYSITAARPLERAAREAAPERIIEAYTGAQDSVLRLSPLSAGGFYTARDRLYAGFVMGEVTLGSRLRAVGGARIERDAVTVRSANTLDDVFTADNTYTDVLPALALNYQLSEEQTLRLSASQTVSRPEYRELAPIIYRDVIGGEAVRGNAGLVRALVRNFDARWEWYPQPGEVLSVAAFAKLFDRPVERVYLATSGTRVLTFLNAGGAENYGLEAELRKGLGFLGYALEPFSFFANATLMRSEIRIGSEQSSRTNDQRPMVGQAPYVVNTGLAWAHPGNSASATLLFNVVGERIVSAGEAPLPDVYEQARPALDLSLRFPLIRGVAAKLDARNLLDAPYEVTQGDVVREHYRTGRSFSLGFSWRR